MSLAAWNLLRRYLLNLNEVLGDHEVKYHEVKYLSNRQQYVTLNDVTSSTKTIKCGVPRVSVLGIDSNM